MSRPHVVSPAELSSLRDLELLARTTVEGLRQGLHRSPFHGYSAEFSQYRHYRPGDDLKYVDWKAFGRTDRLYSRQFRETTNMGALFVLDVSRSMAFPEERQSKFALARAAAAVLATLVIDQGDAAGLLAVSEPTTAGTHYVAARSGRHHLHLCLAELARLTSAGAEGISSSLRQAATLLRRRGLVVVISDLYEEEVALAEIRRVARMGHDVVVVHVLSREELTLPTGGAIEFEDLETGATAVTNPDAVARQYATNVERFLTRMKSAVTREGLDYLRLVTGEPLEPALRRFLVGRRGGESR
ncbi:MAG TPA: DUF58 domain-containing protein [Vicinamibacterales bacterium]|nr:DUF58 domain-containing protein [Vicinamibacterales bacterium]